MTSQGHLFVFGFGYTAQAVAGRLLAKGWRITGTSRDPDRLAEMARSGVGATLFDGRTPVPLERLRDATHVLTSIPPDETGDPVLNRHGVQLAALDGVTWVGLMSTTGVYGDHQGGWVDEETPVQAGHPRSQRRVEQERAWLATGLPVHVFRLAGIYGPGRSAIDDVRAGRARRLDKPGQVFSRIHVEDIASVILASIAHPRPGAVYNLADDLPSPSHEVVADACALLGVAPPPLVPFDPAAASPMLASFYAECRRVRNDRIKRELGVVLRHPTYREGLRAQLEDERAGS